MRRVLLSAGSFIALLAVLAAAASAAYVYRVYIADLERVDGVLAALPPSEAEPPPAFRDLVHGLHPDGFAFFVTRGLISEFHAQPPRLMDWHLRNLVWLKLLPRRLSEAEMLALYAHLMPFEGGRGLAYGARHYYGKLPSQLSPHELLKLFVIAKSPRRYSPIKNPNAFEGEVERLSSQVGLPAA